MEIMELAAELGKALKKDQALVRLDAARKAYEADENVAKLMTEYAVQNQAIQEEGVKENRDEAALSAMKTRVEELYNQIVESAVYKEFEAAQTAVNSLMERVNNTIDYQINGERYAATCTHNCASCGGCH